MDLLHFKGQFTEFLKSYLHRNSWLFLVLLLFSLHQASILTFVDFGPNVISENGRPDKMFYGHVDIGLLKKTDISRMALKFCQYLALLFTCQSVPAFIYGCFKSLRNKRKAALLVLLSPMVIGCLTFSIHGVFLAIYFFIMSPLDAILTFPLFMFFDSSYSTEDLSEPVIYQSAVIGWFYIFWIEIAIQVWLFPKLFSLKSNKTKFRKIKRLG
jgi:hypothetical protein